MTILICIPCLLTGGTEIQTLNLVRALVSGGYRVVTICFYEHTDDMVQRYRDAGSIVEILEKDGMRKRGKEEWIHLYRGLRNCVNKYRPVLAHVQYMAPGAVPCLILKFLGVRHIIATAHTDAKIYRSLSLLHFIQRHVLDVFTCITLKAEDEFFGSSCLYTEETVLPGHAHVTIYNALPEHIRPRQETKAPPAHPTVGVASRLEHIKGMDLVVPAFALLRKRLPCARLLVVGDGSLRESMHRQVDELQIQDAVEWAGRLSQENLQAFYDRMDLFWMPSRSEGFGLSALEAMARGCPVIASDVGGLPELSQDGNCGFLVPVEDVESLAEQSSQLLVSPKEWQRMSLAAQVRARDFSMERFSDLINNLYKKVLE
jgi:glycosyltransferase involved in cell wall biosynthesis